MRCRTRVVYSDSFTTVAVNQLTLGQELKLSHRDMADIRKRLKIVCQFLIQRSARISVILLVPF